MLEVMVRWGACWGVGSCHAFVLLAAPLALPHLALDLCTQRLAPAVTILAQVDAPALGLGLIRLVLRVVVEHVLEQRTSPQLPKLCMGQLDVRGHRAVTAALPALDRLLQRRGEARPRLGARRGAALLAQPAAAQAELVGHAQDAARRRGGGGRAVPVHDELRKRQLVGFDLETRCV